MKMFVVFSAVLALTAAATEVSNPSTFRKIIANCLASDDTVTCFSIKGIMALNRAACSANIEILPGISLQRNSTISVRTARALTENEIIDSLPAEESERSKRLSDLAMDSLTNFIESHSLQVKFPKENSQAFARTIEDGRGLKKYLPLLMALCAKLFLGGLTALAIKALILSKLALFRSASHKGGGFGGLGLLSRVTGSPSDGGGYQSGAQAGWPSGTGVAAQYPNARIHNRAQHLAYNAYGRKIPAHHQ